MNAQVQVDGGFGRAIETISLLQAGGGRLREQAAAACGRAPAWAVLVCDPCRIDIMGAPLDLVLGVLDLEPGQPLVLTLPTEALSRALGLDGEGQTDVVGVPLAATPPEGWCLCLVATRHEMRVIQLPRSGALPAVVVGVSEAAALMTSDGETKQ